MSSRRKLARLHGGWQTLSMRLTWLLAATLAACGTGEKVAPAPTSPSDATQSEAKSKAKAKAKAKRAAKLGPKVRIDDPQGHPKGTIDLRRSKTGHLLVPVQLGGSDFDFILDTGASITVITPTTRDSLGIDAKAGVPVKAAGANGAIDEVRVVNLPPVRVAGREHKGLQAAVMPLEHLERPLGQSLPGILGQNFLGNHRLELDFPKSTVVFHPSTDRAPQIPESSTVAWEPFEVAGLIRIRVRIDGSEPFPAVLDLGAGRSIVNWKAAALAGVDPKDDLPKSAEPLLGADAKALELRTRAFKTLSFGDVDIAGPQLFIGDVGVFDTLGIADGPAMVLGVDLLSDRRLLIDYPGKTLVVSTEVTPAAAGL